MTAAQPSRGAYASGGIRPLVALCVILDISEGLVSSVVEPNQNGTNKTLQTAVVGRKRATKALELVPRLLEPGTRNYGKIC